MLVKMEEEKEWYFPSEEACFSSNKSDLRYYKTETPWEIRAMRRLCPPLILSLCPEHDNLRPCSESGGGSLAD